MRTIILLVVVLGSTLIANGQEKSVAMDEDGKFFVIGDDLERKLVLFPDYPGFREARLYQQSDSSYFLEILYDKDSTLVRDRTPISSEQVSELRRKITEAVHSRAPGELVNQEGRGGLLVNSAILSVGFYGWAVPVVAEMNNGAGIASTYFFVSAAGVLIPYFLTEGKDVTRGVAMMDGYAGTRGIAHGVGFYYLLDPHDENGSDPIGWAALFSVAERVAFDTWATKSHMSDGEAAVIGVGGDAGLGVGTVMAVGYGLWNEGHQSGAAATVLGVSAVGILAGKQLADHAHYTRGDAYILRSLGFLGAGIPGAIADAANPGRGTTATIVAAGTVAGLGLGHVLLRERDYTRSEGLSVMMLEFGGAAIGVAVAAAGDANESAPYSVGAAVGGAAGFLLGFSRQSGFVKILPRKAENLDFNFNPLPLLSNYQSSGDAVQDHCAKMAVNVTYRF